MISGGCLCGKVTYQVEGLLQRGRACHCSRCRKAFSGASSTYAELAPGSSITWHGEEHMSRSADEGPATVFCSSCGSTLCGMFDGKVHGLTLGCVDGDPGVEIEMHLFVGSKAPWDHIGGSAPQHAEFPEDWFSN